MESVIQPRDIHAAVSLDMGIHQQVFNLAAASTGLAHVRHEVCAARAWTIEDLSAVDLQVIMTSQSPLGRSALCRAGGAGLVEVSGVAGSVTIKTAANELVEADQLLDRVRAVVQLRDLPDDARVPVRFWSHSAHGPRVVVRRLRAPEWSEIQDNYMPAARSALAEVMARPDAARHGLALWRGQTGTGKTTALRALARAWRQHCDLHVIVDPEMLLGEHSSYLLEVLFGEDPRDEACLPGFDEGGAEHDPAAHRARLIVLEDAGELVAADARISSGQALSRLLNLTDGLIGQGADVSVLVTTNEPIERLHPALSRPGRGWCNIDFPRFDEEAAADWLHDHGEDRMPKTGEVTLADMYGAVRSTGEARNHLARSGAEWAEGMAAPSQTR